MGKSIARFASWIIYLLEFLIAFIVVGIVLWRQETYRAAIMKASGNLVDWSAKQWPSLSDVLHNEPVRWTAFALLAFAGAMLLGALLRVLARKSTFFLMTWTGLRFVANLATIVSSVWFAVFAYTILFKEFTFLGQVVREADNPAYVDFWTAVHLGLSWFIYLLIQSTPFLFRPNLNIYWFVADTMFSMLPVLVIGAGVFQFWFNPDELSWWTPYRLATLIFAGPAVLIDITRVFTGAFLLIRGYIGEDTTAFGFQH